MNSLETIWNLVSANPIAGGGGTLVVLAGIWLTIRKSPLLLMLLVGFLARSVWNTLVESKDALVRGFGGRRRTAPQTAADFKTYVPRRGDAWLGEDNIVRTVDRIGKVDGVKWVIYDRGDDGSELRERLDKFRNRALRWQWVG